MLTKRVVYVNFTREEKNEREIKWVKNIEP